MKNSMIEESSVNAILEIIGKKLMELRMEKGYKTHADFAEAHDLPKVHYWRIEKGKANVTLKSLGRITAIHNMPLENFFESLFLNDQRKKPPE